jgi:hypothetical protein
MLKGPRHDWSIENQWRVASRIWGIVWPSIFRQVWKSVKIFVEIGRANPDAAADVAGLQLSGLDQSSHCQRHDLKRLGDLLDGQELGIGDGLRHGAAFPWKASTGFGTPVITGGIGGACILCWPGIVAAQIDLGPV